MKEKLFKTRLAEFTQAEWTGKNESGWDAVGDRVIVYPDQCAPVTKGGIQLTDDMADRMTMAAEAGVVVAVGDGAFAHEANGVPYLGRKPAPGDRVNMGRYSGQALMGHDGKVYRVLSSSEIGAIYTPIQTH